MLVDYSDSDDEGAQEQPAAHPKPVIAAAAAPLAPAPPSFALPSAASLFDGTAAALPSSSLPSPGSLKRPAPGSTLPPPGQPKRAAGGALPRQGAAGGLLLPPQLRGRSNVSTEDSSMFTAKTQAALRRSREGAG